ncbi:MAG: arsenite efflux transporter metallochaperone ArsD [Firmicutes bacterium]|nr:arsenite efflux transporter metallochaperone ArsD [Bacillota bacterium]
MKQVQVFDPAMCCSTGVCGPSVDPELTRIAAALEQLKKNGVEVIRHNLGQSPQAFAENAEVGKLLKEKGPEVLPITIVDGQVVKTGSYPTDAELDSWLGGEAGSTDNFLSAQVRELIAIGAAIASNCEPCFRYHYDQARKLGVSKQEMIEAVEVADAVKRAPARNILTLAERFLVGQPTALQGNAGCCGSDEEGCC